MGRVNLCWICPVCGAENRADLDPFEDEEEINWAEDAEIMERCRACERKYRLELRVSVHGVNEA